MPIVHCGLAQMEEFSLRRSLHYISKPMIFSLPLLSLFAGTFFVVDNLQSVFLFVSECFERVNGINFIL